MLRITAPKFAELVIGRKNLKAAARVMGRQTPRKQLSSRNAKESIGKLVPTKSTKLTCQPGKIISRTVPIIQFQLNSVTTFRVSFSNFRRKNFSS